MAAALLSSFTFSPPKTGILKFWDSTPRASCSRSARSGVVFGGMGGLEAGAETGPEAANLAIWAGESGRGPVRVEKIPGAERRGRQNFRNSVFQKSGPSEIFGERLLSARSGLP